MAFSSPDFEVHTGGDDTNNGGGFCIGASSAFSTDLKSINSLGTTSAPVVSTVSYDFVAGDVNAWMFIKSGTNWLPGWYKITAVNTGVSPHTATLDAAPNHGIRYDGLNTDGHSLGQATTTGVVNSSYVDGTASGTWGIDYSQTDGSVLSFTDMVIGNPTTTNFTSTAHPVGKNFIGNIISVTAGTGFTVQRVAIISTSGTVATCDKSLGTAGSTGGTGRMGGALASLGLASSLSLAQTAVHVKSGSYTVSSATTNVTGGCYTSSSDNMVVGFSTRRFDMGTAPVLTASGISTFTVVTSSNQQSKIINLTVDGASLTSSRAFNISGDGHYLTAKNCTNSGIAFGGTAVFLYRCLATGCATAGAGILTSSVGHVLFCEAYSNTVPGFSSTTAAAPLYVGCLAYNNTGATTDGFQSTTLSFMKYINCTAYANGRDGFRLSGNGGCCINCISEGHSAGWGFNNSSTTNSTTLIDNCGTYNNNSGAINAVGATSLNFPGLNNVAYTATAFIDAANGNFALNQNSGGGGALRAHGVFGTTPRGASVGYMDIGTIQAPTAVPGYGGIGFFIQ